MIAIDGLGAKSTLAERLSALLERNGEEAREQWERSMAAEDACVERERPHEHADAVVSGYSSFRRGSSRSTAPSSSSFVNGLCSTGRPDAFA